MSNLDKFEKQINEIEVVMDAWVEKLGLGYNHYAVLYSLATAENGQCTQKQICEEWWVPKQTVFNICKDYKEKGWIEFSESSTDKRERIMRLTEMGKAQAEPIRKKTEQFDEQTFARFGKKKTAQMFALLAEFCDICRTQVENMEIEKND
ncbi:MarR family winged helix-turn-helix transcriptional regulator [Conservatibacter flavescens]|uniref:MarR family transcriptional regulator n=1 Tax=Conservatibacter flavescens TaxID=28161 RepID=A0A2M8S398_9PAST|nr:MarR family winged helix-turn-helix transcriptional regulator [Conservatibacter flavescens]PJG85577.1 MarR family transcriptional regulator [Conservatibacter flavescens]